MSKIFQIKTLILIGCLKKEKVFSILLRMKFIKIFAFQVTILSFAFFQWLNPFSYNTIYPLII